MVALCGAAFETEPEGLHLNRAPDCRGHHRAAGGHRHCQSDLGPAAGPGFAGGGGYPRDRHPGPPPGGGLPRLPLYMAPPTDPWAPGGVTYQFAEVAPPGGGVIESGNVVFTAHTIGSNSANDSGPVWNGQAPPADDDLGNSTLIGCSFGPNIGIANPC